MKRSAHNTTSIHQCGSVIMIMLLILILGSASFLLTKLSKGDARQPANIASISDIGAVTKSLIGYALANNQCLPCPDTNGDGLSDTPCGTGAPIAGTLPWVSLGLGAQDSWGRRLRYVVDPDFTSSGTCTFNNSMQSDIAVQGRDGAGSLYNLMSTPALNPPAVVIVYGTNGFGGFNENGAAMPNPPASHIDEETNRTAVTNLVQRVASDNAAAAIGGPFDDLVGWVDRTEFQAQLEPSYGAWP